MTVSLAVLFDKLAKDGLHNPTRHVAMGRTSSNKGQRREEKARANRQTKYTTSNSKS